MNLLMMLISLFLLGNCAHVPDVEICMRLGQGAYCEHTLSGHSRRLTEDEFNTMFGTGWFFMSPESFKEVSSEIKRICRKNKKACDF